MPSFAAQVSTSLLDSLVNHWGVVLVQQQLGRWALIGAAPGREAPRPNTGPALDRHAIAAWREIAQRRDAGQLWVAGVSRLLAWLRRREELVFRVDKAHEKWLVRLEGYRQGAGGLRPPTAADLNGLAFTAPETAPEILVLAPGAARPLPVQRAPDPAFRLRHAIHLPWVGLEWRSAAHV